MSKRLAMFFAIVLSCAFLFAACGGDPADGPAPSPEAPPVKSAGQIFLYGEQHGVEAIMKKQLEIWHGYYHNENMRHLFVELPYFTAEFLNIWMQSDGDDILDGILRDLRGTQVDVPFTGVFYKTIKDGYPETIFHGTDVGHQHATTGARFLRHLEGNGLEGSEQHLRTLEAIEQGRHTYRNNSFDNEYRVEKKTENFIREFDKLRDQDVMGIYGSDHTGFGMMAGQSFPTLAERLRERYGDAVEAENMFWLMRDIDPLRADTITVGGKEYEASYFGEEDISAWAGGFLRREFWRLENAYDDFKDKPKTGDWLPYDNYPVLVETGQVFVIDYTTADGSVERMFHRSDGNEWQGWPATEGITAD